MRLLGWVLITAVLAVLFAGNCTAESVSKLVLADRGQTSYVIAVGANATVPEKNAASELSIYLRRITGADFTVKDVKAATGNIIAVGPDAALALMPELKLDKAILGDDGIVMKTSRSNLILTGAKGSSRGTLYSVYTFLEDVCGVRWWTQDASYIPQKSKLTVKNLNVQYVPPFRYREALYKILSNEMYRNEPEKQVAQYRFLVQSKYNGHFNSIPADWGGSYFIIGWCHTFDLFMPPSVYFDAHPEWYSEINGKRVGHTSQLCCTNDEMIAELTKNVLAAIANRPEAGIISVSQNDWINNCQCAKCSALDKAEGSPQGSLLYCVNKVAEAVEQKYPGFLVETLAYSYTRRPPKNIRPRKNVLMRLAVIERSGAQPINSTLNMKLMQDLQNWKAAAPNMFLWDYTANMYNAFTIHPNLSVFAPDSRTYADNNVVGVFFEGNHYSGDARGDFDELKTYLMAHMLWNPKANEKKIISEFLNGYYGKAGSSLQQYLNLINQKSREVWVSSCGGLDDASWMDLDSMNKAAKLFDKAESQVADDPVVLARVRRARLQLDQQWLRRYPDYKRTAERKKKAFYGPKDPLAATDQYLARVELYEGQKILADGVEGFDQYASKVRLRIESSQNPAELPEQLKKVSLDDVVDVQDQEFTLAQGANIVPDTKASNGYAAKMDPAVLSWSVQFRGIGGMVTSGKWHVYASIRCDKNRDTGVAVTGGIYDSVTAKNIVAMTANIEDSAKPVQVDPNIVQEKTVTSSKGLGDGEYQLFDFGVHSLGGQHYVWFGTTGGVSPDNVKAIYIDRVIFVKEK